MFTPKPVQTKPGVELESNLSFLTMDLSSSVPSAAIPVSTLKSLPEKSISIKGYVAEVMVTGSNSKDNYAGNYNHTTYFVKVC